MAFVHARAGPGKASRSLRVPPAWWVRARRAGGLQATLRLTATDAAGNRRAVQRRVALR